AMVLDLDDPLRTHIPEAPPGPTVADALSHLTGFQREPPGEIWETMTPPTREELLGGLEDAERVLAGAPDTRARAAGAHPHRLRAAAAERDGLLRRPVLGSRHRRAGPGRG